MKRRRPPNTNPAFGFTLIELLVTLVVLAILLTIGVPSFTNLIANNRATTTANDLLSALQYARSEAVRQNDTAKLCPSENGKDCVGSWTNGWVVLWEDNPNPLLVRQELNSAITVDGPSEIVFGSAGQILSTQAPTVVIQVSGGTNPCRQVLLELSGRGSVEECQ